MGDESTPIFQGVKHFYLPKMVIIDCKYDRSPLKKLRIQDALLLEAVEMLPLSRYSKKREYIEHLPG